MRAYTKRLLTNAENLYHPNQSMILRITFHQANPDQRPNTAMNSYVIDFRWMFLARHTTQISHPIIISITIHFTIN